MNILHTLRSVAHFFHNSRRQGHTTAMLNGARHTKDALVLTHDMCHAQTLARNNPTIDVTAIGHIALIGHRRPVLIDHAAILVLCEQAAITIERNQSELERLETELAQAALDQQSLMIARQTIEDLRVTIAKQDRIVAEQQERTYPPKHPGKTCNLCGAADYACEHVPGVPF